MGISDLIAELKWAGQDFEFYPTTAEIISEMVSDIQANHINPRTVLDIGAGNGKVLNVLTDKIPDLELYAIEKAPLLLQELPPEVFIVGTEFFEQSLLSKRVDLTFCNPPYMQFEGWAEKIVRETVSHTVYLVLPQRWRDSVRIADAMRYRKARFRIVGSFDFLESEDRPARSKVELLRLDMGDAEDLYRRRQGYRRSDDDQAFDLQFEQQFAEFIAKFKVPKPAPEETHPEGSKGPGASLVLGEGYPAAMVALYQAEMQKVQRNYSLVAQLDVELLREFEILPNRVLGCLKQRLQGLRNVYWDELFNRMKPITDRLTSDSRKDMLCALQKNVHVDFTVENIHAIVMWVLKNANKHIDQQLIRVYEWMASKANVVNYKSNQRLFVDNSWRSSEDKKSNSHYALEYRIVLDRMGGIRTQEWSGKTSLSEHAGTFLEDIRTVAANLGFTRAGAAHANALQWEAGSANEFYFKDWNPGNDFDELMQVRAFKNGNLHIKFNRRFMLALNVEFGRLKGWLHSGKQAAEELGDESARDWFKSNVQFEPKSSVLLLTA